MEKRIARIARWLDRCARACSARSWQSALMDMECAKAELEEARKDLWTRAAGSPRGLPATKRISRVLMASVLGLFLIMSVAGPLAVAPADRAERASASADSPSLEWVSTDERALLTALRKSLSDSNLARLSARPESTSGVNVVAAVAEAAKPNSGQLTGESGRKVQAPSPGGKEFDTIINLVQIGQRALREKEAAISFYAP